MLKIKNIKKKRGDPFFRFCADCKKPFHPTSDFSEKCDKCKERNRRRETKRRRDIIKNKKIFKPQISPKLMRS